jgi:hypothetical protein
MSRRMSRLYKIGAGFFGVIALVWAGLAYAAAISDIPSLTIIFCTVAVASYANVHYCLRQLRNPALVRVAWYTPLFLLVSIMTALMYEDRSLVLAIWGAACAIYLLGIILKELYVSNWLQLILWPGLILSLASPAVWWHRAFWFNVAIFGAQNFRDAQRRKREGFYRYIDERTSPY